jgi:nucleoside-diphosphate-sugar epimerase
LRRDRFFYQMLSMGKRKKIKKILVTGSSGTIGTRLCERLLEEGYKVRGVDWKPNKWSSKINELTIFGDLRDRLTFRRVPKKFDLVIHLAANARVYNLVQDPNLARDNFETTFNTLDFTRKNNIKRFMFASSRETYGNSSKTFHSEDEAYIKNCESPYTASKIGGETLVHSYLQCYGINFLIFRFSNVYGMYDDSDRVIPLFIRLTQKGRDLVVFGKEKLLDFTYIEDTVSGVLNAVQNFKRARNDTYNLGSGKGTSIVELAHLIRGFVGANNRIIIENNRTGEVVKFIADISNAQKSFDYNPKIMVQEGLQKTIKWYKENVIN